MRKIKDVLRLKFDGNLSHQQIATALGISKGAVTKYVGLAATAGLDWTAVQAADEATLERRLLVAPERPRNQVPHARVFKSPLTFRIYPPQLFLAFSVFLQI